MTGEIAKILGLTEDEAINQVVDGLKQLGAVYKSHNKHNVYIQVPKGSLLDSEVYLKKAKQSCELYTKRILKVEII